MKTIKTDNLGGYFPKLDDIGVLQDEIYTTIASMFTSLGKNFVVSGCEVTEVDTDLVNISAGIVFIDGEFCRFDGALNVDLSAGNKALVKGAYAYSSPRLFANDSIQNVYKERKAILGTYDPLAE
jgi:hypothetical protein